MKKGILAVIILGMFTWAILEYVDFSKRKDSSLKEERSTNFINSNEEVSDLVVGLRKGNIAPDFEIETLNGERVKLSDYRGKRIMLNFWASWCGPCRAEIPDMQKFYEQKEEDIEILAVNLVDSRSDEAENVGPFVKDYELTFPVLLDWGNIVAGIYQIQPIPTTFLIHSDGRIHNIAYGPLNYELMVQEFEKMK